MQQKMRLLVVGGNGFIGRHIINHAIMLGWDVTNLSLSVRYVEGKSSSGVRCVTADISDGKSLRVALGDASFEYVVNCGGYINHALFFNGGRSVFDAHLGGVVNLVETLNREVLRSFINIGSSDEYGSVPAPQIETQREAPISPYSLGKVAATHFLQMLYRTEGFPSTTFRLFLAYGPGQDNRRFLPQIIRGCLSGSPFPTSEGQQLRDFCFIQDVVEAIIRAFDCPAVKGEVVNIGSGQPISIRQMIESVRRLIGRGDPRFGGIASRPGENTSLFADIAKAKSLLDWKPRVSLDEGLKKTIQWFESKA